MITYMDKSEIEALADAPLKTCKYQGDLLSEGHGEGYGICLKVPSTSDPDYMITAIQEFSTHKNVTLERIKRDEQND